MKIISGKYKFFITLFLLILLVVITLRILIQISSEETIADQVQGTNVSQLDETTDIIEFSRNTNITYENTVEAVIARLKQDVVVTGTITGVHGQEVAIFKIKGMAERQVKKHTLISDGFIVKEIIKSNVILNNQHGDETITFDVQVGNGAPDKSVQEYRIKNESINPPIDNLPLFKGAAAGYTHNVSVDPVIKTENPSSLPYMQNLHSVGNTNIEPQSTASLIENADVSVKTNTTQYDTKKNTNP